jgi:hypothetical protein
MGDNCAVADTTAPAVSITAPSSGSTATGTVNIAANATDASGIARVEFYVDGVLKSTDTASAYSYAWVTTTATNGSHSLTARAYDTAGNTTTSAAVSVTVNNVATPPPGTSLPVTTVTASSADGVNVAANTRDNNLATGWSACGDGQWIQYDLGSAQTVSAVGIAFYNGDLRYSTFDVALSTDATTWTTVSTNQQSATNLVMQYFGFTARSARYVRIIGHGNSGTSTCWNSYAEVEVRGTTAVPPAGNGDANGDTRVNAIDLSILISHDGQNFAAADFNKDGTVGAADMAILLSKWTW